MMKQEMKGRKKVVGANTEQARVPDRGKPMLVDVASVTGLRDALAKAAKRDLRTVESQVLWILRTALGLAK